MSAEAWRAWLGRAESNLARARLGRQSEDILYEDICFDAQQAAEKALKGLLPRVDQSTLSPVRQRSLNVLDCSLQCFARPDPKAAEAKPPHRFRRSAKWESCGMI